MLKTGIYVLTWLKQTHKTQRNYKKNNYENPRKKTKKKEKIRLDLSCMSASPSLPFGLDLRVQSIYNVLTTADFQYHETLHKLSL